MADTEENKISTRFKLLRKTLKKGQEDFAKEANIMQSQVSEIENGKRNITPAILIALEDAYNVNRRWLETGVGHMFHPEGGSKYPVKLDEPEVKYTAQLQKYAEGANVTPVYDHHVTNEKVSSILEAGTRPDVLLLNGRFKDCDLVIRHTDPAMDGFVNPSSFIGIKKISEDSYRSLIIPGKAYVIVLRDYVIERFVYPGVEKDMLLKSFIPERSPDFELKFEEIQELWLIKGTIPVFEGKPL